MSRLLWNLHPFLLLTRLPNPLTLTITSSSACATWLLFLLSLTVALNHPDNCFYAPFPVRVVNWVVNPLLPPRRVVVASLVNNKAFLSIHSNHLKVPLRNFLWNRPRHCCRQYNIFPLKKTTAAQELVAGRECLLLVSKKLNRRQLVKDMSQVLADKETALRHACRGCHAKLWPQLKRKRRGGWGMIKMAKEVV